MLVVGHTVYVFIAVLLQDATGLSDAGLAVEIGHFLLAELPAIPLLQQGLPGLVNPGQVVHGGGIGPQDLGVAGTVLDHGEDRLGLLRASVRFRRQLSGFLKGLRTVGLRLVRVPVLAFLADVVPVLPVGATARLNVRLIEMPLHLGELRLASESHVNVGMEGPVLSYLVAETPIDAAGEVLDILLDSLVRPTVFQRVVDGELILATGFASGHRNSFRVSRIISFLSHNKPNSPNQTLILIEGRQLTQHISDDS